MSARSGTAVRRVVVVGGGTAGLMTACAAARAGWRVTVLESSRHPGGRARGPALGPHPVTLGPRALYKSSGWRMLRRLGVRPRGVTPAMGAARALRQGDLVPGYATPQGLLTTPLLSVRERLAAAGLLGLARPTPGLARFTGEQWLERRLPSARAAETVFALMRMMAYAGSPAQLGADALAGRVAAARSGVLYVDGGWQSVVDALLLLARRLGVEVRAGARAVAVTAADRGPRVRWAEGGEEREETWDAAFVAGLTPSGAARLLGEPEPGTGPGLSTACLDVVLDRLPVPAVSLVYGVETPVYLGAEPASARTARPQGAVLHLARFDDGTPRSAADNRKELEQLLDVAQPGWRRHLVEERFMPRMRTMGALPHPSRGGLRGRPGPVTSVPGVFVTGDWVGGEGILLDAVGASTRQALDACRAYLRTED
ncbi:FAD-dependent oxidoreductase [Streptomyces sp. KL118A]|uniref:FAD-dependent oxidoreductase n=1 Tax=Streptomyces sp. KL118A TaxID=3045153 RepID=UPI00278C5407|nr:FAD-dependent oxidoreductase [Streptomyces sp. KL118A]